MRFFTFLFIIFQNYLKEKKKKKKKNQNFKYYIYFKKLNLLIN